MDSPKVPAPSSSNGTINDGPQSHTKYYREMHHRVFVNRSLHLEKIKFFGFDMDYTLAEYITPAYESLSFKCAIKRLIDLGYPKDFQDFEYDPAFPVRGLWFDKLYGNLLKVDPYGNILVCVHGFSFLKTAEIYSLYPNKFVQMDDARIHVLNTLFDQTETYLLACIIDFFSNRPEYQRTPDGVTEAKGNLYLPYMSIAKDIRDAIDHIHKIGVVEGSLKKITVDNPEKYMRKNENIPLLFKQFHENGKKTFLLTNSDYVYTNKVMTYLFDVPAANGQPWQSYFDYVVVDARKPLFFGEGVILRQVDTTTGALRIGTFRDHYQAGAVYSGGNCDVFTKMIGSKGRDILYVGDHIYGDILKSKKTRGWRTFLIVPELAKELNVWTSEKEIFHKLTELDILLADKYKHLDSSCPDKPDISQLKIKIRETIHQLDMNYGILGSIFRCGSRQTHFANQMTRYADLYACSFLNLLHYPFSYLFRAPPILMPHESTVVRPSENGSKTDDSGQGKSNVQKALERSQSLVPHLYAEKPTQVTHHHDTDEEDSDEASKPTAVYRP
ncbi:Cytosolic purine 5'-nucleotidase [Halotydeus destructor]|nr:Cytosolic purine 5'-nucleotidase [Halotydeus destructor]